MKKMWIWLVPFLLSIGLFMGATEIASASNVDLYYRPEPYGLDWTAIKFFLVGALLLFTELFIPGFGVVGMTGIVCIVASFYFALGGSRDTIPVLAAGVVVLIAVAGLLMKYLPKNPVWKRLALSNKSVDQDAAEDKIQSSYLGKKGRTLSLLRPSGVALIDDKRIDVLTEGDFIPADSPVVVVKVEGRKIFVEKEK